MASPAIIVAQSKELRSPPLQHSSHAKVLVNVRPVNAYRHDLEIRTLLRGRALEPRIPVERRRNLATIDQRHHELGRRELHRAWAQIADVNLQNAHSRQPRVVPGTVSDAE